MWSNSRGVGISKILQNVEGLLKITFQGSNTTGIKSAFLKNPVPKPFTEQYNPKSYLKNMILFPEEYDPVAGILFYE